MDYYKILGLESTASQDEIKLAYRKLAMKHHPDRGGDSSTFQEISRAYETLSNPQSKQQYDMGNMDPGDSGIPPGWHNVEEMFGFHFGRGFTQQVKRNKDLTIKVGISIKQSYLGSEIEAKYNLPSGKQQNVSIAIPAGIQNGQVIRCEGLGDDSISTIPRGHLNVHVSVMTDDTFIRQGNNLCTFLSISVLEAMIGCTKKLTCLDDSVVNVHIPPGTKQDQYFTFTGKGFKDLSAPIKGNLVVAITIEIPTVTDPEIKTQLKELFSRLK